MANPFSRLPNEATLDTICAEAGKVFAARKEGNSSVDFNTEIWFLAGDAVEADLLALRGMARGQVAKAMGDSISKWINAKKDALRTRGLLFEERSGTPGSEGGPARWFALTLRIDDSGNAIIRETDDTNGHHMIYEDIHIIEIRDTHLPSLAALVARRCGRTPTADHEDDVVTCLRALVDHGELGPQLGFGGNDRVIRSWLDEGRIPYRRLKSEWCEGMSMPELREVPSPNP